MDNNVLNLTNRKAIPLAEKEHFMFVHDDSSLKNSPEVSNFIKNFRF